jgi:hypothetical protein
MMYMTKLQGNAEAPQIIPQSLDGLQGTVMHNHAVQHEWHCYTTQDRMALEVLRLAR